MPSSRSCRVKSVNPDTAAILRLVPRHDMGKSQRSKKGISPSMEANGFQIGSFLRSLRLLDRKQASGSCRGVSAKNQRYTWLK